MRFATYRSFAAILLAALTVFLLPTTLFAQTTTIAFQGWVQARDLAVIEAFEAAYPNIKVEYRPMQGRYENLIVPLIAGEGPDVMTISWAETGNFLLNGLLTDLTPYIEADANEIDFDDFFPAAISPGVWQGRQYALPATLGAQGLVLNTDLFNQAGLGIPSAEWTWDDFGAIAKQLTRFGPDGDPTKFGWQNTNQYAPWMSIVYSYGGRLLSDDFSEPIFDSPETVTGLTLLRKLVFDDRVTGGAFLRSTVGMVIRPSETMLTWLEDVTFDWAAHVLPSGPAGSVLMGGAHQLGLNRDSANKDVAWTFIKFYLNEGQLISSKINGAVPIRASIFEEIISSRPDLIPPAQQMPVFRQYTNRNHDEINRIWQPIFNNGLYTGTFSPAEAAIRIQEELGNLWIR